MSTTTLWRATRKRLIEHLSYPVGGVRYEVAALEEFKRRARRPVKPFSRPQVSRAELKALEPARIRRAMREVMGAGR